MPSLNPLTFICPTCSTPLSSRSGSLECPKCASRFDIRDGIVDLRSRRHDYYFNPVSRPEMQRIIEQASTRPWDDTVRDFLRFVRDVPTWTDNVTVNGRYSWKLFLDLPPEGRFLDFGCGLGNLTHNIAAHVGEVVALDLTWERLRFAQQRFTLLNPGQRISLVAGGDGTHLPFPDAHFDAVALSGVLEWIAEDPTFHITSGHPLSRALQMLATQFGKTNPRRMQLKFLQELRRILKPDGQLFVAIENRWNHEYFAGRRDHHSALKYGSLLPRLAATVYSIGVKRRPYRTYTYTLPGLTRLLRDAGFRDSRCLGLTPGYSGLREVIAPAGVGSYWAGRNAGSAKTALTRHPYFVPAFGMIASPSRERMHSSLLARLVKDVERTIPALATLAIQDCKVSGKDKVVLSATAGEQSFVIKVPASPSAARGEEINAAMVEWLGEHAPALCAPKPIGWGAYQGLRYFVETAVPGEPLKFAWPTLTRAEASQAAGDMLDRMHPVVADAVDIASPGLLTTLVDAPVARLAAAGLPGELAAALSATLRSALAGHRASPGFMHGDFSRNNIFVLDRRFTGVIDLEYATTDGVPVLDAIAYVESIQRHVEGRAGRRSPIAQNLRRLSDWSWDDTSELALLERVYGRFNVAKDLHPVLCTLCWLLHVSRQAETVVGLAPSFMRDTVLQGLEVVLPDVVPNGRTKT